MFLQSTRAHHHLKILNISLQTSKHTLHAKCIFVSVSTLYSELLVQRGGDFDFEKEFQNSNTAIKFVPNPHPEQKFCTKMS